MIFQDDSHEISYLNLSKTRKDVAKFVVCCSRDWPFKGLDTKWTISFFLYQYVWQNPSEWKGLTLCLLCNFAGFFFCRLLFFFSKSTFSKNYFRNTIRVSNSLDLDQAWYFVRPDWGPKCLQRLSADDTYIVSKEWTGQELHKRLQSSLEMAIGIDTTNSADFKIKVM